MASYRFIPAHTRSGVRTNGYQLEVVYEWTDAPYSGRGVQQSFYSNAMVDHDEMTIRERLASIGARVLFARDMASGRFVSIV